MADFKSLNGYQVKDEVARDLASSNSNNIATLQNDVNTLKDTTNSNTSSISTIQNNMSTINQNMAELHKDMDTTISYVNSVQAGVEDMNETYSSVTSDIANLKNDNAANKDKINTLETDNSTNKSEISGLKTKDTEIEGNISGIESRVEALETSHEVNNANLKLERTIQKPLTLLMGSNYEAYGNCFYYKIGTRVSIHLGIGGVGNGSFNKVAHLPEGYRPSHQCRLVVAGGSYDNYAQCVVDADGSVYLFGSQSYIQAHVEFDAFN